MPLAEEDVPAVIRLVALSHQDEPMTVRLGVSLEREEELVSRLIGFCLSSGVSIVAKVGSAVVGAMLCMDEALDIPTSVFDGFAGSEDYGPILQTLNGLRAQHRFEPSANVAAMWMGACASEFRGRGIHFLVSNACVEACRRRGFDFIVRECSGVFSLRNALKAGFVLKASVLYADFEWNGRRPLVLDPNVRYRVDTSMHDGVHLLVLDLRAGAAPPGRISVKPAL